jgi:hypothetical protein
MKTPNHALDAQCKLNRRGFLWATATGLAGLAGVLALQQPLSRHLGRPGGPL